MKNYTLIIFYSDTEYFIAGKFFQGEACQKADEYMDLYDHVIKAVVKTDTRTILTLTRKD